LALEVDHATREALVARLRFYRDLGLAEFYRRPVDPALMAHLAAASASPLEEHVGAPGLASETWDQNPQSPGPQEGLSTPSNKQTPALATIAPATDRAAALQIIRDEIGECTRCGLHTGRHKLVFGDGNPEARLMFVGEGPGADEDAQGLPFVGKAGQLLNNMITAMGLKREEVYIANVVKCRPPGNRDPEPDEIATCRPWLEQQLDLIVPKVVVTLGKFAAQLLLDSKVAISKLRGREHPYRDGVLIPTWHPAYVLRGGAVTEAEMRADLVRAKLALVRAGSPLVGAAS